MASTTDLSKKYQQKTEIEHILHRPNVYIGSILVQNEEMWIKTEEKMENKTIQYIPALYKLFDEGIVNCRDHVVRMKQSPLSDKKWVSYINVSVSTDGTITMVNDGDGLDIAKHPDTQVWIPEMIFGHLRTSTNYEEEEKRMVGGQNGLGFKLVLIWSTYGLIETIDHRRGLKYTQEFVNNLSELRPPTIVKVAKTLKPYTKVVFKPDYNRFGITLTPDMISLFWKRTIDICALTDDGLKVSFNGTPIPIKNFQKYVDLYIGPKEVSKRVYENPNERWEYIVALSPTHEFAQVSFVNGICTYKGGKHVDYIMGKITRELVKYIEKKKKVKVNANSIKEQLFLFLKCDIENPSFDSQSKDCLNTTSDKFGSTCEISDGFIEKVAKMGVMDLACSITQVKEETKIAKTTDGKKGRNIHIDKYSPANFAGTAKSKDCTLILCEGDSAKAGVLSGLSKSDRDIIGIYPLKGKVQNVRGIDAQTISKNKEITELKQILGLENGRDYKTIEEVHKHLNYSKIMTLCDADSVTGDTPLLLKNNEMIEINTIDNISETEWINNGNKEYSTTNSKIWTDKGWTKINKIIRHKVNKRIFRVLTHTGIVDVTEDHSLIRENNDEVSPKDIKVDETLLHSFPNFYKEEYNFNEIEKLTVKELHKYGKIFKIQRINFKNKETILNEIKNILQNPNLKLNTNFEITDEEAYVMGLFWADGSCGIYNWNYEYKDSNRPKAYIHKRVSYNWNISNTNLEFLNKAKSYLEKLYNYEFKIIECDVSEHENCISRFYRLVINGGKKTIDIVEKYRRLFYNKDKKKKVPIEILNSPINIRQQFLYGYHDGDGKKSHNIEISGRFDIDGKIGAHGIYFLCKSLGYEVSINVNMKKQKVHSLMITKGWQQDNPNRIKKIFDLGVSEQYVYDLETENHHFQAGVGRLIVHNTDGSHIKGLLINLFDCQWPSLLRLRGFISYMNTPILRATKGNQQLLFYNEGEYQTWKQRGLTGYTIKYFKGLGTSTAKEFKEYFANKKIVNFDYSEKVSTEIIDMAFNKERADDRKRWLEKYDRKSYLNTNDESVKYEEFINKELIHFSIYNCERSIPNMMDGLKTSQRKILYSAFKRNLVSEIKVAQFSGYVSEHSSYHHGEASLQGAIIGMAQNYVGSNNINLLEPNGQFGTRCENGADHASPRYIFTKLNSLTRLIYPKSDDAILTYLEDDGESIEPEYYVPILPMILINGSEGIGMGYSSEVVAYSPKVVIQYLRNKLTGVPVDSIVFFPYYEGFRGKIEALDEGKFLVRGLYEKVAEDTIRITESPVGMATNKIIELLKTLSDTSLKDKTGKSIPIIVKDYKENNTDTQVDIVVEFISGKLAELEGQNGTHGINGLEKCLKLTKTISTSNMYLFDFECKLKKYARIQDIIEEYCETRLEVFQKRKDYLIVEMEKELLLLSNRARYILAVLDGSIDLRKKTKEEISQMLEKAGFSTIDGGFEYLVKMRMDSVSKENVEKILREKGDTEKQLSLLKEKTIQAIWLEELAEFEKEYDVYKQTREIQGTIGPKAGHAGPTCLVSSNPSSTKKKVVVKK
jgi:DNA gyrase/topoisomerase IV subunit B